MSELKETLDRLSTLPMFEAERPANKREIQHIEAELDVVLPEQYVEFLQRFGYAGWFGHEILGIRPVDRSTSLPSRIIADCVSQTKATRASKNRLGTASLPPDHIVIATDGGGGNFVLFTVGSHYEGQVHWYNFEDMIEPINVWMTFRDYIEYEIENALNRDAM